MSRDRVWSHFGAGALSLLLVAATAFAAAPKYGTKSNPAHRVESTRLQREFNLARKIKAAPFKPPGTMEKARGTDRYELELGTGTFKSPGASELDPGTPGAFELLCYNQNSVGQTIRVKRGEKFQIRVNNKLKGKPDADPGPVDGVPEGEKPHGLSTTNLHTHGLHVSPDDNSDNIFQLIDPGAGFTFEYKIPDNHVAGTFWYHPHKHGSVAYQLSNGLAGALIVEGRANDDAYHKDGRLDLEDIPEIRAATEPDHERVVVLQLYTYRIGDDGVGRIDASQIYNVQPDSKSSDSINVTGDAPPNTPVQVTAINGVINPELTIAQGEVQRWRIVHAGWDLLRQLVWVDENDASTDDVQFHEIAIDGLPTGAMTVQPILQIAPGQRSDVLIQGPSLPKGKARAVYHLKQLPVGNALAPHNRATDPNYLARLVVSSQNVDMQLPDVKNTAVAARLARCRPFRAIEDAELSPPSIAGGTLQFLASDDIDTYTIAGQTFHQNKPVQIQIGRSEEWALSALVGSHPFHIHVNPFQVVSYTDPGGFTVPLNVWRDTLYIPEGASYRIRSRFQDFIGDSVLHCHILDHEDQGMMMCLQFRDAQGNQPKGPGCPPMQKLKVAKALAPALKLPDAQAAVHELREFRGHDIVLVFFRGLGCPHCTGQLRRLIREAREAAGADVSNSRPGRADLQIVAVSSEPIKSTAAIQAALELSDRDSPLLLVDSERRAFRDFGCLSDTGEPKHGLFIIDREGAIRAGYAGDSPFEDTSEVLRQVSRLTAAKAVKTKREYRTQNGL